MKKGREEESRDSGVRWRTGGEEEEGKEMKSAGGKGGEVGGKGPKHKLSQSRGEDWIPVLPDPFRLPWETPSSVKQPGISIELPYGNSRLVLVMGREENSQYECLGSSMGWVLFCSAHLTRFHLRSPGIPHDRTKTSPGASS